MKKGFTFVEIMVVISLILIFTLIIIININDSRKNSRDKARIADINSIKLALSDYYSVCKKYPDSLSLSANNCEQSGITFGDFIGSIPTDPSPGGSYLYVALMSDCSDYHLGAEMEIADRLEFDEDHDYNSTAIEKCNAGTGFDASDDATDLIYDFRRFSFQ